ncbi:hypothetical protein AYO43_01285 [Nitrospira sp. SCGC AG-212-E16]|nr:hypothetical protein AYO43_01285 [Nitrospira sp. SCGC AG-212-E16]
MREEIQELMRVCQALAGVAHEHALTDEERGLILNFVRALEQEIAPPPLPVDAEIPLTGTLANVSLLD